MLEKFRYYLKAFLYGILSSFNNKYNVKSEKYKRFVLEDFMDEMKRLEDIDFIILHEDKINRDRFNKISGKYSYAGYGTIVCSEESKIGAFCSIATDVVIGLGEHPQTFLSTHPFQYARCTNLKNKLVKFPFFKPVVIGNDVWIGYNAMIKEGLTIGDGAIIGGGIVTHNIPPYAVVAGVPARIIKYRFSEEIISKLLRLKWWELDDSLIEQLPFDNIEACIEKLEEIRRNMN